MASNEMQIILTLEDKVSEGLKSASSNLEKFGSSARQMGRELSQVGGTLTMTGAAITGPFILALKNASKNIPEVSQALARMQNVANLFQEKIAKDLVPIINQFGNILNGLYNAFNNLSPVMQNAIIQTTFMSGVFLTLGGSVFFVIGKITSLIGNLSLLISKFIAFAAVNAPLLITLGVVIAIGAAMWKWKPVADTVMSTFEALFLLLKNGFLGVKMYIEEFLFSLMMGMQQTVDLLAKIPGPSQDAFRMLSNEISITANTIRGELNRDLIEAADNVDRLTNIIQTGSGSWSKGFDNLKIGVIAVSEKLKQGDTTTQTSAAIHKKSYDAMRDDLGKFQAALSGAASKSKALAVAAQVLSIGLAIMDTACGVSDRLANREKFPWPVPLILAGLVTAAGAVQVATIASQKFAQGTDTVPAMLSPGEMVFPSTMADAIRRGDISVSGRGSGGGDIYVEVNYPQMSTQSDVSTLAEQLGFEIERKLRSVRAVV